MKKDRKRDRFVLTMQDIIENSDPLYFQRGLAYFHEQAIYQCTATHLNPKTLKIESQVYGSHHNLYNQNILINTLPNGKANIIGDCDCPVGFNCKHVIAACLYMIALQNDTKTPSQKETLRWLEKFKRRPVYNTYESEELLLYKLFETESYGNKTLGFYKTKLLKKGGFGKIYRIEPGTLFQNPHSSRYVNDEDVSILKTLKALRSEFYPYDIGFEDELGALALKKMVATNRCYFDRNREPLGISDEIITLQFSWEEIDEDKKRIVSNLNPLGVFIPTIPLMYIDPISNTLHEIKTNYDAQTIPLLLEAPPVDKEDINLFMGKAMEMIPDVDIPIPEEFQCEEISDKPLPHLNLHTMTEANGRMIHYIAVSFDYASHTIAAYPEKDFVMIEENGQYLKIARDLEYERSLFEEIHTYGFTQSQNHDPSLFFSFAIPDMQTAIERWRVFLEEEIPKLEQKGWIIVKEKEFDFQFNYAQEFTLDSTQSETHSWFDLSYEVNVSGQVISLLPLVTSLLEEFDSLQHLPPKLNLKLEDGSYLHIDAEEIKPILQTIFELYDHIEGDHIKIEPRNAHLLSGFENNNITWKGSRELAELSQKLRSFEGIKHITPAQKLSATLRQYQQFGLNWLNFLSEFHFGGILADDMGLGKTLQTLAFLQKQKEQKRLTKPTLIIMPTSLIGNWKNEIDKFTSDLSYLALYGSDRAELFSKIDQYDLILTTYQLCLRDREKLQQIEFHYIILDEAQKIKNPKAKMTIAIKSFRAKYKLALSGTPMENHLGELWSIFDFLMPGFLGNLTFFKQQYQNPIEKNNDITKQEQLKRKIAPFMLRRTKEEVLEELPEKVQIIQKVTFGKKQALLYENVRVTMEKRVTDVIKSKGIAHSHITILDALLKLRQICCDPALLSISEATKVKESAKLETLFELLEELLAEGRKILLFSQFTTMLKIIEESLIQRSIIYTKLTGQTRKREEAINRFKKEDCNLFLISLKAGGVGLNLTEADTVIHYDPWWNPAVENQATDRAHRIGQAKSVFVYKLVVENSIEEKILTLQESKKKLYKGLYDKKKKEEATFQTEDLIKLLQE